MTNLWDGNQRVSAGLSDLVRQASETTSDYLRAAIRNIDEELGKGYAEKHSELIGALVNAAATDFQSACILLASQNIESGLDGLQEPIFPDLQSAQTSKEV